MGAVSIKPACMHACMRQGTSLCCLDQGIAVQGIINAVTVTFVESKVSSYSLLSLCECSSSLVYKLLTT